MGEALWLPSGGILSNLDFRNRLLDMPGWETFKNLLRFYAELAPKIPYEVKDTIISLGELERRIDMPNREPAARPAFASYRTDDRTSEILKRRFVGRPSARSRG